MEEFPCGGRETKDVARCVACIRSSVDRWTTNVIDDIRDRRSGADQPDAFNANIYMYIYIYTHTRARRHYEYSLGYKRGDKNRAEYENEKLPRRINMDAGVNCLDGRKREECAYDSSPPSLIVSRVIVKAGGKRKRGSTFARRSIDDFSPLGRVISETCFFPSSRCTND